MFQKNAIGQLESALIFIRHKFPIFVQKRFLLENVFFFSLVDTRNKARQYVHSSYTIKNDLNFYSRPLRCYTIYHVLLRETKVISVSVAEFPTELDFEADFSQRKNDL